MKICSRCKENKLEGCFKPDRRTKDGLHWTCQECLETLSPVKATKICSKCREEKPISEFNRKVKGEEARNSYCIVCNNLGTKAWQEANPDRHKAHWIKHKFGEAFTVDLFNEYLLLQKGRCKICQTLFQPGRGQHGTIIDHCHATGKVRGLLCRDCNFGLGNFKDSPERLRAAANYLDKAKHLK